MISVSFPRMFDSRQTVFVYDHNATRQALEMLLLSERQEFISDPEYGTNLKSLIYNKGNMLLKDVVIDDIYQAIRTFLPQIQINRDNIEIEIDKRDVKVKISCVNLLNSVIDLYEIKLLDTNNNQ